MAKSYMLQAMASKLFAFGLNLSDIVIIGGLLEAAFHLISTNKNIIMVDRGIPLI